ncbi:DUF2922 domain-containing protein [Clostridium saccharoperbutylacetonicum]|uniref:DUF2922 domain-containing protein n=1 Tax=Clostridium saccharoperbutylacetonicum TaxID=36745 RepID=UPI000A2F09CA|nr:DUF2922 domain-containing protein [Clostridium saccharoperbutylacetonicum]
MTLNIPGIKTDITKEEINSLIDTIISKDVLLTNSGNLIKKSAVQVTQGQVVKFDVT